MDAHSVTLQKSKCMGCTDCIKRCPTATDQLEMMKRYTHRIALPAPSFYAQFPKAPGVEYILEALLEMGFTDYFEVAIAAEVVTSATYDYLKKATHFPIISSACPAIVRLVQSRFPSLIPHILPILSPMELAARYVKAQYAKRGDFYKKETKTFENYCLFPAFRVSHGSAERRHARRRAVRLHEQY